MTKKMEVYFYFCWMLILVTRIDGQCFIAKTMQYRCAKNNVSDVAMVDANLIVVPRSGRLFLPATGTEVQAVVCTRCPCTSVLPGNPFSNFSIKV